MSQYLTQTRTAANTMTAARVREVLIEVRADMLNLVANGICDNDTVLNWIDDLSFILEKNACQYFEVQLIRPGKTDCGFRYEVHADGSLHLSDRAGGVDLYGFPRTTTARLFVHMQEAAPHYEKVLTELKSRGWGTNGVALTGNAVHDRNFVSGDYGVSRSIIGDLDA